MTLCKVLLNGLKPSDINYSTNDKISEIPLERQRHNSLYTTSSIHHVENTSAPETDFLNLHIKPMATSTSSVRERKSFIFHLK
jgi:hypothetical protein